jgi:hypothetical protein
MSSSERLDWIFPAVRMSSSGLLDSALKLCPSCLILLVTSFTGWVVVTYVQMLRQRATLPPGPFPWPIVGNVLQLSKSKPWLQFKEWSRANNNGLLTIWIGRTPTIICNDAWSASDIMEKRSNIYSSRPRYVVFGEVTGQSTTNQVLLPYSDHWRLQRKVMVSTHSVHISEPCFC